MSLIENSNANCCNAECRFAECCYADFHRSWYIYLGAVMPNDTQQNYIEIIDILTVTYAECRN